MMVVQGADQTKRTGELRKQRENVKHEKIGGEEHPMGWLKPRER